MSSNLSDLLPELRERILLYCTLEDVKNLSVCNSVHRYLFNEMLWQNVKIPWNCLADDDFETSHINELDNLRFTRVLRFWTDKTHSRINESISQVCLDRISHNYIKILESCNGRILHQLALRNGVVLSHLAWTETSHLLFSVKVLTVENTLLPDCGFSSITTLRRLVELSLEDMSRCTTDTDFVSICEGLPQLVMLNLRKTDISEEAFSHLPKLVSLKELNIGTSTIDDSGLAHVSQLNNITTLRLGGCSKVSDIGISYLPSLTLLEDLDVYCCKGITNAATLSLCKLSNLKYLKVGFNNITDAGAENLTRLNNLLELNISGTGISTAGVQHLVKMKTLEKLNLRHTLITDAAILYLCDMPSLRELSLQMCYNISDTGLSHLMKMPCLEFLNIRQVHVGESGLRSLASLKHLKVLKCERKVSTGLSTQVLLSQFQILC